MMERRRGQTRHIITAWTSTKAILESQKNTEIGKTAEKEKECRGEKINYEDGIKKGRDQEI
jgi:hypothetical protein